MTRWQHAPTGNLRYWTRERVIEGLRLFIAAQRNLPTSDSAYNELKRGHEEWPPASRVLGEFGSMARGFMAAGAGRVSLHNIDWTPEEDDFVLANAGIMSLRMIARQLGRSPGSIKARLNKTHGIRARDAQGFLSAQQLAAEYRCPLSRVFRLIDSGDLKAVKRLGRWCIEPPGQSASGQGFNEVERARLGGLLSAPKTRSYKGTPPDVGDYYQRYHVRRRRTPDGRIERYEATA